MLPRTPLFMLLATSLLAEPSLAPPKLPAVRSVSEGIQDTGSIESLQSSNDDKYTLRGTVVNSLTGEPIRAALVQISFNGGSSMLTGPDGRFQFDGLPAGQISITVRKPGFFAEPDLQSNGTTTDELATAGPNTAPTVLRLVPEGVIYGRISEEDGEPIDGLPVRLTERKIQDGRKVWQEGLHTTTIEDGSFRIAELRPGTYLFSAGPSRTPLTYPSNLAEPGAQGIPVVYYPHASDLAAATPIAIGPGKRFEVNLSLSPNPFYSISGSISGYGSGQSAQIRILDAAGQALPGNWRFDAGTGSFRLNWVPAGIYTLRVDATGAQGQPVTAAVPVTVNSHVAGMRVVLLPNVSIPIQLRMISARTVSEDNELLPNGFPVSLELIPRHTLFSESRYQAKTLVRSEGAGTIHEFEGVAPGEYELEISPTGAYYVQSAISGMTNLLESNLQVATGSSVSPIEIVLRDDVASLSGNVSLFGHTATAMVVAIPERYRGRPTSQPTDPNGAFQFEDLAPGIYKVLALDRPEQVEYADPEVMKKYLSKAREINLSPNQAAKLDLESVKVEE